MKQLLTPKLDLVFKLLFTQDTTILLDLINTVLASPEHLTLRSLEVKNPTILPEELTEKFIILDILANDERGQQYDIEMQVQKYAFYPERTLYYLSKMYAGQLESGNAYSALKPVIGIHFIDYEQFPEHAAWQWSFELRDKQEPAVRLTDHLLLHVVELPKFDRVYTAQNWGTELFEWFHFFNHAHEEGEKAMQTHYHNPAIKKAFHVLEKLSSDEETRYRAEIREKALKNEVSMLAAAREEGWEEGREEGKVEGLIQGLYRGIETALDIKFGQAGVALMSNIHTLKSVKLLEQLNDMIKQEKHLEPIRKHLDTLNVPEQPSGAQE